MKKVIFDFFLQGFSSRHHQRLLLRTYPYLLQYRLLLPLLSPLLLRLQQRRRRRHHRRRRYNIKQKGNIFMSAQPR